MDDTQFRLTGEQWIITFNNTFYLANEEKHHLKIKERLVLFNQRKYGLWIDKNERFYFLNI